MSHPDKHNVLNIGPPDHTAKAKSRRDDRERAQARQ
jgi:hypothetical protein